MFKLRRNYWGNFFLRHCSLSIILVNFIATLIITVLYYYAAPFLMNHSPIFNNIKHSHFFDFRLQIALVDTFILVLTSLVLWCVLRSIDKWHGLLELNDDESVKRLVKVREKCMNAPYLIFVLQIGITFAPALLVSFFHIYLLNIPFINLFKVLLIEFSSSVLLAVITFIFSKLLYNQILIRTYNGCDIQGKRIPLRNKILLLIFPLFVSIVLISYLVFYSSILRERGHFIFREYETKLNAHFSKMKVPFRTEQLLDKLRDINVEGSKIYDFVISPRGDIFTSNQSDLDTVFSRNALSVPGEKLTRIYGNYSEVNGAVVKMKSPDGYWVIGVKYNLVNKNIITYVLIGFILGILAGVLIVLYFMRAITMDVFFFGNFIKTIAKGQKQEKRNIPVTSNDEIGDLIVAFNRIRSQDMEYDKLKTEFLANISHELRTPLTVLLGTIQLIDANAICKNSFDPEKMRSNAGVMRQNCYRLLRLVNNFIDATSIDAGTIKPQFKNCNIVSVVEETVLTIVGYAEKQGLELYFDTEVEEKIMAVDIDMTERIVINLLSNAIKFAGKGSIVYVKLFDRDDDILISVKDNGAGIPAEKHDYIFERFTHVEGLLTRKREGAGMGLYLVKSFVELLGGSISLKSEEGKGCEFLVKLPVALVKNGKIYEFTEKALCENSIEKASIELSDIS